MSPGELSDEGSSLRPGIVAVCSGSNALGQPGVGQVPGDSGPSGSEWSGSAQAGEGVVVQQPVGGHRVTAVRAVDPVK